MPRNAAAEMYSLLIAEAFQSGVTPREATIRSEAVAPERRPTDPDPSVAATTVSTDSAAASATPVTGARPRTGRS
ncbi:hypothetical protein DZF91_23710 [Actinomadura logoneensis]|uniref:Uncharacterized protein n=1 Tax=Actinomadura logoneensis TaxID=2293572 RepID=A0A372JGR6_9ACTN|nr:hypothetical protein DZF91_23710 [Actinomadura logoneensis]